MVKSNQPLQIRLTEPVIFLRGPSTGFDLRGRPQLIRNDGPPAMLRGLLTLRLSKPTKIRSIAIKLTGKARTEWPEGVGPKRLDTYEEHIILAESLTFFSAKDDIQDTLSARRAMSVGPGIPSAEDEDDEEEEDDDEEAEMGTDDEAGPSRGRARNVLRSASAMPGQAEGRSDQRARLAGGRLATERPLRERGPSPAYTSVPGPMDLHGALLRDRTPLRTILSPITSANNSQNNSTRGDSGSTERRFNASPRTPRQASSPTLQSLEEGHAPHVQFMPTLGEAAGTLDGQADTSRVSIDGAGGAEVRFASAPSYSREPSLYDSEHEHESGEGDDGEHTEGEDQPPVRSNRAASIRTLDSQHSLPSAGEVLSPQGSREGSDGALYHPSHSAIQPISNLTTPARSPVLSPAGSTRHSDELQRPPSTDRQAPDPGHVVPDVSSLSLNGDTGAERRGAPPTGPSLVAPGLTEAPLSGVSPRDTPSHSSADLPAEVREGRRSSTGQTSTIVTQPGPSTLSSGLNGAGSSARSSPRGSMSETRSAVPPPRDAHPGRSRFSISAAFRNLSKSRDTSRSRSRQPSIDLPPSVSGAGSRTVSQQTSRSASRQPSSSSAAPPANIRGQDDERTGRIVFASPDVPDFVPPTSRGAVRHRTSSQGEDGQRARSRSEHSPGRRGRNKGMKLLTGALGREGSHESPELGATVPGGEEMHNWKEFKKGVYNYPICFPIPADAPPTVRAEFGSVTYKLKATVVRAGALTSNLVEDTDVIMIATPQDDDMEESENVIVERQWEEQMRYQVALSGKAFPIGGTIPFSVRLMPLAKCKVHRLSACLEEKTDYFALGKKVARHETPKRFFMLFVKQPEKLERIVPLLPIISSDVKAAINSPLAPLALKAAHDNPVPGSFEVDQEDDAVYASLMDPQGPWHLEKDLKVPDCATAIHFSTKHAKTNITVAHVLKVTIRVERGDDDALDAKGRRKQFDIIIETPIKILDCRVSSQLNSLPTYALINPLNPSGSPSVCSVHGDRPMAPLLARTTASTSGTYDPLAIAMGGTTRTAGFPSFGDAERGRPPLRQRHTPESVPLVPTHPNARHSGQENEDTLLERNIVYDRLISGQETEMGELPPTYGEAVRTGSRSQSRADRSPRQSVVGVDEVDSRSGSRSQSRLR